MDLEAIRKAARERAGDAAHYAGELAPEEAWEILANDPDAVLVDVRTEPELAFVGVPDLSPLGKRLVHVEWQVYPSLAHNPNFGDELRRQGVRPEQTVIFMCRSGSRSRGAAEAMARQGFAKCFNLMDGFEGPHDERRHRGTAGGWKAKGLPWIQG